MTRRLTHAVLALLLAVLTVWGAAWSASQTSEWPPVQETGWNHRNFR